MSGIRWIQGGCRGCRAHIQITHFFTAWALHHQAGLLTSTPSRLLSLTGGKLTFMFSAYMVGAGPPPHHHLCTFTLLPLDVIYVINNPRPSSFMATLPCINVNTNQSTRILGLFSIRWVCQHVCFFLFIRELPWRWLIKDAIRKQQNYSEVMAA